MNINVNRDLPINEPSHIEQSAVVYADLDDKDQSDIKDAKKRAKASKKAKSDKPSSVGLLNREVDADDLLDSFFKGAGDAKAVKKGLAQNQRVTQELNRAATEFLKGEMTEDYSDVIKLTQNASLKKQGDLKKKDVLRQSSRESRLDGKQRRVLGERGLQAMGKAGVPEEVIKSQLPASEKARQFSTQQRQQTIAKYMMAYSDVILSDSPQKKQYVETLQANLETMGVSLKKMKKMEGKLQQLMHHDVKQQIKGTVLDFILSFASKNMNPDLLKYDKKYKALKELGEQIGLYGDDREVLKDLEKDAKRDVRRFITETLDNSLVKGRLKGGDTVREIIRAFDKLNMIAGMAKFDSSEYMKTIQAKMLNWGLLDNPNLEIKGALDSDPQGGKQKDEQSFVSDADDIVAIEEQLRLFYMQRYVKHGLFERVDVMLKIRRLKRHLVSLGGYDDDKMETLKEEAQALARVRLMDLLTEAFEERATLPELKGTSFHLVQRKLKIALKGFRSLKEPMVKNDLKAIRDRVNHSMFSVIKETYIKIEIQLELDPKNVAVKQSYKQTLMILERLKAESHIQESIKPKEFEDATMHSDMTIIEAV